MGNPSARGGIMIRNVTQRGKLRTLVHIEGQDLYHIDADVNPGASGGPVLDLSGKVIAVIAMKADDKVVAEIRDAMRKLDDNFRTAAGAAQGGITYGIPGSALARVLESTAQNDGSRQAAVGDKYAAQTLVARMHFLAGFAVLSMAVNVPLQVRLEAQAFAKGEPAARPSRFGAPKVEYVPLMPENVAKSYAVLLHSGKVKEIEEQFRRGLDARLDAVGHSPHVADDVKRDLKTLAKKLKEATAYAERPGVTYMAYSVKVKGLSRDIKELIERLQQKADDK
jgi:hypothetical protein